MSGGYSQLLLAIATVGSFLLGLSPVGDWCKSRLYVPYLILKILRFRVTTNLLQISTKSENKTIGKTMDRRIYKLHVDLKKVNIYSFTPFSIGNLNQFKHNPSVNILDFDKILLKRLHGIGDRVQQDRILKLLKLWNPYLTHKADSRLIEVLYVSILCILGYEIPFEWKEQSFEIIRFHFLRSYNLTGKINIEELYLMLDAEKYLMKYGEKFDLFKSAKEKFLSEFESDKRQNLNSESTAILLQDATNAFYTYGDHIRRTK